MADRDRDSVPDVRWMSYGEAAEALGVNPESIAKRCRRNGWARRIGNDKKPRVAVPVSVLLKPDAVRDTVPDIPSNTAPSVPVSVPDTKPPEAAVLDSVQDTSWLLPTLALHLQAAMDRADGAEAKLLDAVREAAAAKGEAEALRRQVEAASQRAARMEGEREAAREELAAWWQGGPLTRALLAFFRRGQA